MQENCNEKNTQADLLKS